MEDRLYLVTAAGLPAFRETYDALVAMGFYNLNPEVMKELQSPDAGEFLHRDGGNIASVAGRSSRENRELTKRIGAYLSQIVPDIEGFYRVSLGPKETLEFRQKVKGAAHPWKFYANSMSDGTLRALAARADHDSSCVLAKIEFETWFVAAAESLGEVLSIADADAVPALPEEERCGKGWIDRHFKGARYSPTVDQAGMVARMDMAICREGSPSFDKLCREIEARLDD